MIDLGAWASESYRIPVAEYPDTAEDAGLVDSNPPH
jgi:endogenous inhibitor of DNA gyrase (YacG/DUF329 family)